MFLDPGANPLDSSFVKVKQRFNNPWGGLTKTGSTALGIMNWEKGLEHFRVMLLPAQ